MSALMLAYTCSAVLLEGAPASAKDWARQTTERLSTATTIQFDNTGFIDSRFRTLQSLYLHVPVRQRCWLISSRRAGTKPSRLGIFTLGSDCASTTDCSAISPLRARISAVSA